MQTRSSVPLYRQVEASIKLDIDEGRYPAGTQLPTENELCDLYGVSKITVRKALASLKDSGVLESTRGKGTFVGRGKDSVRLGGGHGFNNALGEQGRPVSRKLLLAEELAADERLAARLEVAPGTRTVHLCRLMFENATPIGLDDFYASAERFDDLMARASAATSLYDLLAHVYGVRLTSAQLELNGVLASQDNAAMLGCLTGDPLFLVRKVQRDEEGVAHYSVSLVRCDMVTYTIDAPDARTAAAFEMDGGR